METRVLRSHLPAELAEKLDRLAERLDRPKGWIVKKAIASYVAIEERRHRMTLDALRDVDANRLHDHAAVLAWARDLGKPKRKRSRAPRRR